MKVVLDTNIILAAISPYSPYRLVFDKLEESAFTLCVSTEILLEYEEKLSEIFNPAVAEMTLGALLLKNNVQQTAIFYQWRLIFPDLDDNKFVDCAIAANADFLVTNDRDFRVLSRIPFPKVQVLNMGQFLDKLMG